MVFVCLCLVLLKLDPPEWLCTGSVPWTRVVMNRRSFTHTFRVELFLQFVTCFYGDSHVETQESQPSIGQAGS